MKNVNILTKISMLIFAISIAWVVFFPSDNREQNFILFAAGIIMGYLGLLFLIFQKHLKF